MPFFEHKECPQKRFDLGIFSKCTSHSWNLCSSLAKYLWGVELPGLYYSAHPTGVLVPTSSKSLISSSVCTCGHFLLSSARSVSTALCAAAEGCRLKFHWLKSNGFPVYPWLFLAGSVPDPIHYMDTQTAVSVLQKEDVWGKQRRGLAEFNHHWYQVGNHNHEWLF